ncbi:MAG: HAD-IC family P-type ATPase, partial [Bacillota bacterium]
MAKDTPVYKQSIETIAKNVSTDIHEGLSESEATKRLNKDGKNQLESEDRVSLIRLFVNQFKSFVMLLLTSAAVASFLIGEVVEGIAVLVVILITAFVGLIMEYRAGKSIEALKQTIKDEVTVLRDGKKQPCLTEDIVKGDIVILDEGDKVPADGRLITNQGLSVDESMLTGESDMVDKTTDTLEADTKLADRKNMVFMGSHVVKGDATYIVTATALDTEMGHISSLLKDTKDEDTPLEKRLEQTGRFL